MECTCRRSYSTEKFLSQRKSGLYVTSKVNNTKQTTEALSMRVIQIWWRVPSMAKSGRGVSMKTTHRTTKQKRGVIKSHKAEPKWRTMRQIQASNWLQALQRGIKEGKRTRRGEKWFRVSSGNASDHWGLTWPWKIPAARSIFFVEHYWEEHWHTWKQHPKWQGSLHSVFPIAGMWLNVSLGLCPFDW